MEYLSAAASAPENPIHKKRKIHTSHKCAPDRLRNISSCRKLQPKNLPCSDQKSALPSTRSSQTLTLDQAPVLSSFTRRRRHCNRLLNTLCFQNGTSAHMKTTTHSHCKGREKHRNPSRLLGWHRDRVLAPPMRNLHFHFACTARCRTFHTSDCS